MPVTADWPEKRIVHIYHDSQAKIVLTSHAIKKTLCKHSRILHD
ncbi:MAG: hypothetical protein ACLUVI_11685 [Acutalibacteraceae bacterium]